MAKRQPRATDLLTTFWRMILRTGPLLGLLFVAGCASGGRPVDQAMQADKSSVATRNLSVAARYMVGCPDVLEVRIEGQLEFGPELTVGPEGRIVLGTMGSVRVEGQTVSEIAQSVAELAQVPARDIQVRVVEHQSQQVYLFGEVTGLQRAVAYRGEETVSDLLQRAGGISSGAAPARVHVIRPRVTEGKPPLIFNVDLQAVVMDKDQSTNLRVQPFDQIYVGETHRSSLEKCIPPLLRPLYQACCGLDLQKGDKGAKKEP